MYYLTAPFALLATTFVTAVLATPMSVHIRRDKVEDIIGGFNATALAIILFLSFPLCPDLKQTVNTGIQGLSQTSNESEIQKVYLDFATSAANLERTAYLVGTFIAPFNKEDSQKIATEALPPLLTILNDTAPGLQNNPTADLGSEIDFSNFVVSLASMTSGIQLLNAAARNILTKDAVERLNITSSSVENTYESLLSTYLSFSV